MKGAQTPRKSACKEPRIQVVLTVKIGGSLPRGSGQSALVFPTISGVGRGAKRGSERNRYAGNRSNFAARRTGPGSGVRDVINVSQALLNPRCAPSIPQRPLRSAPYSINTLKRCSDEADRQTGFTGMGAIPAIHPRRNGHPDRAMPVAEREKRRQWPLRRIPPRMDQRAVPTPLPHEPGQLRWRPQPPPAKLRRRPQPPPTISTRMKNAVTPKSSPINGTGSNKPSTLHALSASPCWLFGVATSSPVIVALPVPGRVPVSWPGGISRWGIGTSLISEW